MIQQSDLRSSVDGLRVRRANTVRVDELEKSEGLNYRWLLHKCGGA